MKIKCNEDDSLKAGSTWAGKLRESHRIVDLFTKKQIPRKFNHLKEDALEKN